VASRCSFPPFSEASLPEVAFQGLRRVTGWRGHERAKWEVKGRHFAYVNGDFHSIEAMDVAGRGLPTERRH
jgi:hypothetical protein